MFHAPMGRFQLELIYYFTYFFTVVPSNSCVFLSCRPFVVNTTFSTGLVGVEVTSVSCLDSWQLEIKSLIIVIVGFQNVACCLVWPGQNDQYSNFSPHQWFELQDKQPRLSNKQNLTSWKCRINDERPTGKKHTSVGWDDGGKIGKIIN